VLPACAKPSDRAGNSRRFTILVEIVPNRPTAQRSGGPLRGFR